MAKFAGWHPFIDAMMVVVVRRRPQVARSLDLWTLPTTPSIRSMITSDLGVIWATIPDTLGNSIAPGTMVITGVAPAK